MRFAPSGFTPRRRYSYPTETLIFLLCAPLNFCGLLHARRGDYPLAIITALTWNLCGLGYVIDMVASPLWGMQQPPQRLRELYFFAGACVFPILLERHLGTPEAVVAFCILWLAGRLPLWLALLLPVLELMPVMPLLVLVYAYHAVSINICSWIGIVLAAVVALVMRPTVGRGTLLWLLGGGTERPPSQTLALTIIILSATAFLLLSKHEH